MKTRTALLALAIAAAAAAMPALASDRSRSYDAVTPKLTLGEVDARVRANGYAAVHAIELRRDGTYEVKAIDAESRRAELRVDGNTGDFLLRSHGERHSGSSRDDHGSRHRR